MIATRFLKHVLVSLVTVPVLTATCTQVASADTGNTPFAGHKSFAKYGICAQVAPHVALAPGLPRAQTVSGTFCWPFKPAERVAAVDLLVHGATYDRTYWDSPFDYPEYSYVNRTLRAGRAVFYYDRLGVGGSSRLPSTSVTMDADAYVIHQLLQWLHPFYPVENLIGHSYGSRIAALETAQYNDATRVVLTASLHATGPVIANGEFPVYPANQDPQFINQKLDDGWMTSVPGTRKSLYNLATADPREIAYDESHKAILSNTELVEGRAIQAVPAPSNITNKITRPLLLILGEEDRLYCGLALDCTNVSNITAVEAPYYTHAARLTIETVAATGHDMALHPSADESFAKINDWLQ